MALSSLAGRAAVTNNGDDTVSIIDLDTGALRTTVSVAPSSGTSKPIGIALHPGSGQVVVADSNASQVSFFDIASPATPATLTVDVGPYSQRSFAWTAGGGLDFRLNGSVSLRPIQAEYFQTRFSEMTNGWQYQNNVRVSAGFVLHFF